MNGLVSQRLVRVLCPDCREPYKADSYERRFLKVKGRAAAPKIFRARGCVACGNEGYRGRIGIYEIVKLDEGLRKMIHSSASELEMEKYARETTGSIRDDGRSRVINGDTTVDEVLRVTMGD